MKYFKFALVVAMGIFFGANCHAAGSGKTENLDHLIKQRVCGNNAVTNCATVCSRWCGEIFGGGEDNRQCVEKYCSGLTGYCNLAVMSGREEYPGTLVNAKVKRNEIPKVFFNVLKSYEDCLRD